MLQLFIMFLPSSFEMLLNLLYYVPFVLLTIPGLVNMARTNPIVWPFFILLAWTGMTLSYRIVEGPVSVAVDVGDSVKLTCRVVDQGDNIVRWFNMGANATISGDMKVFKRLKKKYRITGVQGSEYSLNIRSASVEDMGTYGCGVLSSEFLPVIGATAEVAVVQPPQCNITSPQPPAPGVTVTLSCLSRNPGLDVQLTWHRPSQPKQVMFGTQGTNLTSRSRISYMNLTLGPNDFGESFFCKETLSDPTFTRYCSLTPLQTYLQVILFPKQMQAVQGQNATFRCILSNKKSVTYEWYIKGIKDYSAKGDSYNFFPATIRHNNTKIECRVRDKATSMTGNASSILYVYPNGIRTSPFPTRPVELFPTIPVDPAKPRVKDEYVKPPPGETSPDGAVNVEPTEPHVSESQTVLVVKDILTSPRLKPSVIPITHSPPTLFWNIVTSEQASDNPQVEGKIVPGTSGASKWSEMMVPILVVGSVIALLLVCVIVVLLLFLIRQNRVGHGSMGGKDGSRKHDVQLDDVRHHGLDSSPGNRTLTGDCNELECDEGEGMQPKYFTLEPDKRRPRRLERTCSHTIVSDPNTEYNVLCRNASLRLPAGAKMNDYARPESQLYGYDPDMSTVTAYAVTDVTLVGGTSSLKRNRSCMRPLPAAPIEAVMNRSHYNIPRDTFRNTPSTTESSGDSITVAPMGAKSNYVHPAYRRSQVPAAFVPGGDEYAEIDSPPRPASPDSWDCSRPTSPNVTHEAGPQAMKDFAASLASSYESGYDAASSDDVMEFESSTSPYAGNRHSPSEYQG